MSTPARNPESALPEESATAARRNEPTTSALPLLSPTAATSSQLRVDLVEHLMRLSGDELTLLPFLTTTPGSRAALTALGRMLGSLRSLTLVTGSPLMVWCSGGELDPQWRSACPPAEGSLWQHYAFLASLYGVSHEQLPEGFAHAYDHFELLRSRSEDDLEPTA